MVLLINPWDLYYFNSSKITNDWWLITCHNISHSACQATVFCTMATLYSNAGLHPLSCILFHLFLQLQFVCVCMCLLHIGLHPLSTSYSFTYFTITAHLCVCVCVLVTCWTTSSLHKLFFHLFYNYSSFVCMCVCLLHDMVSFHSGWGTLHSLRASWQF